MKHLLILPVIFLFACNPKPAETQQQPTTQQAVATPTPVPTPDPEKEALKARVAALENEQRAAYAPPTPGPAMIENVPFRILSSSWLYDRDGERRITGTVRNMSGKSYSMVFIKIGIMLGDIQTESVVALVDEMQPGATCLFTSDPVQRAYARWGDYTMTQPTYRLLGFEYR